MFIDLVPLTAAYADVGYLGGTGSTNHQPWVQGKALSIYGTIAWITSLMGAGAAASAWSLPRRSYIF